MFEFAETVGRKVLGTKIPDEDEAVLADRSELEDDFLRSSTAIEAAF